MRLRIGRLSGVVPDAMRFCFDLVTAGTPLEGAALDEALQAGTQRQLDATNAWLAAVTPGRGDSPAQWSGTWVLSGRPGSG